MTRRRVSRICPYCQQEGMLLHMGGYTGTIYKCPNCQYVGPLVLERESDNEATETEQHSLGLSKLNNTLNWAGALFGLSFILIGALVGFAPLPLTGRGQVANYGLALFVLGGGLVALSALFWLFERPRHPVEAT